MQLQSTVVIHYLLTCEVRMLLTGSTRTNVAKEASATRNGAQHHTKN